MFNVHQYRDTPRILNGIEPFKIHTLKIPIHVIRKIFQKCQHKSPFVKHADIILSNICNYSAVKYDQSRLSSCGVASFPFCSSATIALPSSIYMVWCFCFFFSSVGISHMMIGLSSSGSIIFAFSLAVTVGSFYSFCSSFCSSFGYSFSSSFADFGFLWFLLADLRLAEIIWFLIVLLILASSFILVFYSFCNSFKYCFNSCLRLRTSVIFLASNNASLISSNSSFVIRRYRSTTTVSSTFCASFSTLMSIFALYSFCYQVFLGFLSLNQTCFFGFSYFYSSPTSDYMILVVST